VFRGLLPHQREGVRWMLDVERQRDRNQDTADVDDKPSFGGVLADDMGLGKTYQASALVRCMPRHTLIVTKPSIVGQWRDVLFEVTGTRPWILIRGTTCDVPIDSSDGSKTIAITSYNSLACHGDRPCCHPGCIFKKLWERVVLDEAHYVRNKKTAAFKAVTRFRSAAYRWALTGTPINNGRRDLAALAKWLHVPLLDPEVADRLILRRTMAEIQQQRHSRTDTKEGEVSYDAPPPPGLKTTIVRLPSFEYEHEKELYALLQKMHDTHATERERHGNTRYTSLMETILRMRQACTHPLIYVRGVRQKASSDLVEGGGGKNKASLFSRAVVASSEEEEAAAVRVVMTCNEFRRSTKTDYVARRVRTFCEEGPSVKVLVFCEWIQEIGILSHMISRELRDMAGTVVMFTGRLNAMEKAHNVQIFERDPQARVMLVQIRTGGTGLNLQVASKVVITSPAWNPCNDLQALCRSYRQGQAVEVACERILISGTIEEKCLEMQRRKMDDLDELFEEDTFAHRMGW